MHPYIHTERVHVCTSCTFETRAHKTPSFRGKSLAHKTAFPTLRHTHTHNTQQRELGRDGARANSVRERELGRERTRNKHARVRPRLHPSCWRMCCAWMIKNPRATHKSPIHHPRTHHIVDVAGGCQAIDRGLTQRMGANAGGAFPFACIEKGEQRRG